MFSSRVSFILCRTGSILRRLFDTQKPFGSGFGRTGISTCVLSNLIETVNNTRARLTTNTFTSYRIILIHHSLCPILTFFKDVNWIPVLGLGSASHLSSRYYLNLLNIGRVPSVCLSYYQDPWFTLWNR